MFLKFELLHRLNKMTRLHIGWSGVRLPAVETAVSMTGPDRLCGPSNIQFSGYIGKAVGACGC